MGRETPMNLIENSWHEQSNGITRSAAQSEAMVTELRAALRLIG